MHTEAEIISVSPNASHLNEAPAFIETIPQNPIKAPKILFKENRSSLNNKKEKQANKSGAACFKIAVFELSVRESPA